jgi:ferric-dicitrate binding protein FerR (iron transport regulator)
MRDEDGNPMNTNGNSRSTDREADSERAWRELFSRATPRQAPPSAAEAEIRAAVYAEWDALTGRRVLWRRLGGALAAAAVLASVVLLLLDTGTGPALPAVARVERLQGTVQVDGGNALQIDASLPRGSIVATRNGQTALRLAAGGSLRLAPQTELRLTQETEVELLAGALYFDSEGASRAGEFAVLTAVGTLRDVGTQFIARLDSDRLEVGVRDGRVALARGAERADAGVGEKLTVPDGGGIRRETIATYGDEWAWAERLAPPFDIDGRSLIDFLTWVSAQTGRSLAFSDAAVERTARETLLSGSIDLEPLPKLAAVVALTDLDYSLDGDRILIRAK